MNGRFAGLAAIAMLAGASPLAAAGEGTALPAVSPEEDMRCAIWASVISGGAEDALEQEVYAYAMHLFLGRYEAATGKDFRAAMTEALDVVGTDPALLESYDPACAARWDDFVGRLRQWGESDTGHADAVDAPVIAEPAAS